jgi:RNA polymerase sigma-70 factor (ECF subfamily)
LAAAERLVAEFAPRLYRYALVRLKRSDRADDAVGEVFCRLVQKGPSLSRPTEHIHGWCVRCMVNVCREVERRPRCESLDVGDGVPSYRFADWHGGRSEEELALTNAMSALSPRQQEAIILRIFMGLSVHAAAHAMECADGTVKALTHQGVALLRRHLRASQFEERKTVRA